MKLNSNLMAVINPSSFGMPACGHAFDAALAGATTTSVVRERQADTTGDMGFAIAYVPGTSAWRPPSS